MPIWTASAGTLPPPGRIGVFDRSHYEDVLVVRVDELVPVVAELDAAHIEQQHERRHDGEFRRGHGTRVAPQIPHAVRLQAHELT